MARVLVTGGAGYIGSHTVEKLILQGNEVVVYDNLSTGFEALIHPEAIFCRGDILDVGRLRHVFSQHQIESVLHFAAFISVEESLRHPEKYYSNNLQGTLSLLKICQEFRVRNFIFSSTAAVYAPTEGVVTEDSSVNPVTPYGKSKMMSEIILRDLAQASDLRFMILRYFNVAGASSSGKRGQMGESHTALIKRAALAAAGQIEGLPIFGTDYPTKDGTAVRDYIHVEDLAEIHVLALQNLKTGGNSMIFNCGYGKGFTVREVIQTMKKVSGVDFKVLELPRRDGDLGQVVADTRRLSESFNWKPRFAELELICRSAFDWEMGRIKRTE